MTNRFPRRDRRNRGGRAIPGGPIAVRGASCTVELEGIGGEGTPESGGNDGRVEITERFPLRPWKSRTEREIPTFPPPSRRVSFLSYREDQEQAG